MPKGGARPGAGRKVGTPHAINFEARIAARQHAEEAMKVQVALLGHPKPEIRLAASECILNRAFGRPAQAVEVKAEIDHTHHMADDAEHFTRTISGLVARASTDESVIEVIN